MAKKKIEEIVSDNNGSDNFDIFAEFMDDIKKDKSFSFSEFDDVQIKKSTGFDIIDAVLAGSDDSRGFQLRTFNTFYGNSGSGKSTLLFQMAYNFIKDTESGVIFYYDGEKTMTQERIEKLKIDNKRVKVFKQDTTIENYYKMVQRIADVRSREKDAKGEEYIMNNPVIVIVDSFNALSSERELDAGTDINSAMGVTAKMHSVLLKTQIELLFKYNITVLGILQVRDELQIGPTPKAKTLLYTKQGESLSGGRAIPYYSFYLGSMKTKKKLDESYGIDGIEVEFTMVKSKTSAANKPITMVFFPVTGYSNLWTNYRILIETKGITAAGAYKKLPGYEKNWYTRDLEKLYNTDEEFRIAFDNCAREKLTTYIDNIPVEKTEEDNIELEDIIDNM